MRILLSDFLTNYHISTFCVFAIHSHTVHSSRQYYLTLQVSTEAMQRNTQLSRTTHGNTKKRRVQWVTKASLRPFYRIRQVWGDYKTGRMMRKREGQAESHGRSAVVEDASELGERHTDRNIPRNGGGDQSCRVNRGWEYHDGREFPWRIERIVEKEENWRGVWVLEVKDMWSMEWTKEYQQRGCQWRLGTLPQAHWPVPYEREGEGKREREPDKLYDWLERP